MIIVGNIAFDISGIRTRLTAEKIRRGDLASIWEILQ